MEKLYSVLLSKSNTQFISRYSKKHLIRIVIGGVVSFLTYYFTNNVYFIPIVLCVELYIVDLYTNRVMLPAFYFFHASDNMNEEMEKRSFLKVNGGFLLILALLLILD